MYFLKLVEFLVMHVLYALLWVVFPAEIRGDGPVIAAKLLSARVTPSFGR